MEMELKAKEKRYKQEFGRKRLWYSFGIAEIQEKKNISNWLPFFRSKLNAKVEDNKSAREKKNDFLSQFKRFSI